MVIELIATIISFFSLVASTALTVKIFLQTEKNTKDQLKLQEQLNQRQNEFEAKQLKIQQRPDKVQAFKTVFDVYKYMDTIEPIKKLAETKTFEQLHILLKSADELTGMNSDKINIDLFVGEFFVSNHIKPTFAKIRQSFWKIRNNIERFFSPSEIFTEEEKANIVKSISDVWLYVDMINKTRYYIQTILESEVAL